MIDFCILGSGIAGSTIANFLSKGTAQLTNFILFFSKKSTTCLAVLFKPCMFASPPSSCILRKEAASLQMILEEKRVLIHTYAASIKNSVEVVEDKEEAVNE